MSARDWNWSGDRGGAAGGGGLRVALLVPEPFEGSGGHTTAMRLASGLAAAGHDVVVHADRGRLFDRATDEELAWFMRRHFPARGLRFRLGFEVGSCHAAVATAWTTALVVAGLRDCSAGLYLVQDYEPFFYPLGEEHVRAEQSYRLGLTHLALGPWLAELLRRQHGAEAREVPFGVDHARYSEAGRLGGSGDAAGGGRPRVVFYARPSTARRGTEVGLEALARVKAVRPEVEVVLYGARERLVTDFEYTHAGVLGAAALADLYRGAAAGLVLSYTNVSLVPLEMMACGCPVVAVDVPPVRWLLEDGDNAVLADSTAVGLAEGLLRVLGNDALRSRLSVMGPAAVERLTWDRAREAFVRHVEMAVRGDGEVARTADGPGAAGDHSDATVATVAVPPEAKPVSSVGEVASGRWSSAVLGERGEHAARDGVEAMLEAWIEERVAAVEAHRRAAEALRDGWLGALARRWRRWARPVPPRALRPWSPQDAVGVKVIGLVRRYGPLALVAEVLRYGWWRMHGGRHNDEGAAFDGGVGADGRARVLGALVPDVVGAAGTVAASVVEWPDAVRAAVAGGERPLLLADDYAPFAHPMGARRLELARAYAAGVPVATLGPWLAGWLRERHGTAARSIGYPLDVPPLDVPEEERSDEDGEKGRPEDNLLADHLPADGLPVEGLRAGEVAGARLRPAVRLAERRPSRVVYDVGGLITDPPFDLGLRALTLLAAGVPGMDVAPEVVLHGHPESEAITDLEHVAGGVLDAAGRVALFRSAAVVLVTDLGNPSLDVLRALACGCAVVAVDAAPLRALVEDGVSARLVAPVPEALAAGVAALLADPERRAALAAGGRAVAARHDRGRAARELAAAVAWAGAGAEADPDPGVGDADAAVDVGARRTGVGSSSDERAASGVDRTSGVDGVFSTAVPDVRPVSAQLLRLEALGRELRSLREEVGALRGTLPWRVAAWLDQLRRGP